MKAAITLLLSALAISVQAGSATIAVDGIDANVKTLQLLVSSNKVNWVTNSFPVTVAQLSQSVTNTLTNLFTGTNFINAQVVGTNNTTSDPTTNGLRVVVPKGPTDPVIVPLSFVVEDGGSVLIARDITGPYRERFTISSLPQDIFVAAVSTPPKPRYQVTWRTLVDGPQLFAISQPEPTQPPLP